MQVISISCSSYPFPARLSSPCLPHQSAMGLNTSPPSGHYVYTSTTMNGWKPLIFLEEAGIEYVLTFIDFGKKEQKSEKYVALSPITNNN
jgi:hypothetical protein